MGVSVYKIIAFAPWDFKESMAHAGTPAAFSVSTYGISIIDRTVCEICDFLVVSAVGEWQAKMEFLFF